MGCIAQRSKFLKESNDQNNIKDITNAISTKKKIVLAGLQGSGKTSILQRIKYNTFSSSQSSQSQSQSQIQNSMSGLHIDQITINDNLDLIIYDVDGTNKKAQNQYLIEADAVIYVIDSSDRQRMWRVKEELSRISSEMKYSESAVLVLFNKYDKEDAIELNILIQETGVHSELDLDVFIQKCSAKSGEGLKEGFEKLINYFLRDQEKYF